MLSSFFSAYVAHHDLHSFPTRRSSDLGGGPLHLGPPKGHLGPVGGGDRALLDAEGAGRVLAHVLDRLDRKSTRLNSSHSSISYAVFCLKKKKIYSTSSTA